MRKRVDDYDTLTHIEDAMKNNPNTSNLVIASSTVRPADVWTRSYRLVLRLIGGNQPYAIHTETLTKDGKHEGYHNGHYCADMLTGVKALAEQAAKDGLGLLDSNGKRMSALDA